MIKLLYPGKCDVNLARGQRLCLEFIAVVVFMFLVSGNAFAQTRNPAKTETDITRLYADNFMKLYPTYISYTTSVASWTYEYGLMLEAFYQVWKKTGDQKYYDYMKKSVDALVTSTGSITGYSASKYALDDICPGKAVVELYNETTTTKYKTAAAKLRTTLTTQPRTTEGGFWHKQQYPSQMWLDGLYMGEPFYAIYAKTFNDTAAFTDITRQFLLIKKHLRDTVTGLYFHGWDETKTQAWANQVTGTSASFWGRAMGWYMMAMLDVLDYLPTNNPNRTEIISMFSDLSGAVLKYRDPKQKLWYQVVDKGTTAGNYIEASASLMFAYSYLKGASRGYLSSDYGVIGKECLKAAMDSLITTDVSGNYYLQHTCQSAGLGGTANRDGTFAYYISEPQRVNDFKGYGALMLATTFSDITATGHETRTQPANFELLQNYPNPFNPSTTVQYVLAEPGNVTVKIYDMMGRELMTLLNGYQNSGTHSVMWNGNNVASGVYFLRVTTNGTSKQQKLVKVN